MKKAAEDFIEKLGVKFMAAQKKAGREFTVLETRSFFINGFREGGLSWFKTSRVFNCTIEQARKDAAAPYPSRDD